MPTTFTHCSERPGRCFPFFPLESGPNLYCIYVLSLLLSVLFESVLSHNILIAPGHLSNLLLYSHNPRRLLPRCRANFVCAISYLRKNAASFDCPATSL